MPNDASPEAYKLLKAMMDVTTAYAPERGRLGETHILAACATRWAECGLAVRATHCWLCSWQRQKKQY